MSRKLLKSTLVVGVMTLVSRISGLVRDIVFANIMGSGLIADAFFVAFRIPNFFRRIFGEGAFSQSFIPVYSEYRERNTAEEVRAFMDHMAGVLAAILVVLVLLGIWAAPGIVMVIAPGYLDEPDKFEITVDALRLTFPYLLFISLVAMSQGLLNTCGRFGPPAVTPVLLNLCMIAAAVWLVPVTANEAIAVSIGVLVAGVLQLVFQVPFLHQEDVLPVPRPKLGDPGVKRVFRLMLPAMFGVSVAQINILIGTLLASFLVTGSVSWLYYSDRVMEFPLGVFGIALATVMLPSLSKLHANNRPEAFSELLDWSLRWVFLISVPAMVGMILLSGPILSTLFLHGSTTPNDIRMMSLSLTAYAVGLAGFVLVKVLAPGFFARQDMKTPVKIAAAAMVVNIILSLILVSPLQHTGLALATSLAAWINASLLLHLLMQQGIFTPQPGWLKFLAKVAAAAAAMSAVLLWGVDRLDGWMAMGILDRVLALSVWIAVGAVVYFLVILACGIRPSQLILKRANFDQ
ncbi:MAG: murein biosynthesis integral membrane protein MurJ [Gammaproteobacteria bacterium]|nr:murein biosynthesis integral membrane protein MurJ [Gammaproteobacteria bacterium]